MFRTAILAASLALAAFMSQAASAGQPAVAGALSTSGSSAAPAASAAADKVYPPLPTLAMLPPSAGDDDEPPLAPKPTAKKRKVRASVDLRPAAPAARLVVSETTRTYLRSVEKQLDLALAK
ncbi:hypothetical protein G3N95_27380 [Paraburkholderia sp. Tr-20389]|uniref:hypothetical protein n=1 Tax=Paraburkholderia sp. Tr-20389 TaxID=2703903 RepID=UPI00197FD2D2|nr:hypothetical protein [Paraburkholderia sp. Tr-20389]MBN3756688.1 hypothetical protein [Paraburkholderia sp. Tr-20389]